ncbi:NPCBM/NEW2 domain-containing protein, partial [Streptomyces sp. JJ38]|uniref:NPCBM/NEW2 domain-containing protein n=1 Tax=Streptomyces sp. JJ38 TaxID=2738128 RepID=UPI001C5610AF
GIVAGALAATAAATALVLALSGSPRHEAPPPPQAAPSAVPSAPAPAPEPEPEPEPVPPPAPAPEPVSAPSPPPSPEPEPSPPPSPSPQPKPPAPKPPPPSPTPTPTPPPPPPPPVGYPVADIPFDVVDDGEGPAIRVLESSPVWQRSGVRIAGQEYAHGITVPSPSSVFIDLGRACASYEALAGVDDLTMGIGAVTFSVFGDGRELWRSGAVEGGEPPERVSVPLDGVETLRLDVEPASPYGWVAQADWAQSVIRCG